MSEPVRRVVITGVGLVSPLGDSLDGLHNALCEGRSGLRERSGEEDEPAGQMVADLPHFDPRDYLGAANFRPLDRASLLAASAAQGALEDSGWSVERRAQAEVGLVLGTMFGSIQTISRFDRRGLTAGPQYVKPFDFANSVINAAAGQTAIWHDLRGVNATISAGIGSGLQALGYGADLIRNGQVEAVLAGGVEELGGESLWAFCNAGLLCPAGNGAEPCSVPFDRRRNGLAIGEGAAFLMLEDAVAAAARGARVLATLTGFASAFDGLAGGEVEPTARLVSRVVTAAAADAGLEVEALDCVSVSANGSPSGDRVEALGLGVLAPGTPVTAIKSMLGEPLGASGALQTASLVAAMRSGRLPGICGLVAPDDDLGLDLSSRPREISARRGLVHALDLDGTSSALILELAEVAEVAAAGEAAP